jgi:Domain of unknown function (DUF4112)
MLVNNAIAAVIGFVPVVGDICIAVFKTNSRNAALMEEYLRIRGEESLKLKAQADIRNDQDVDQGSQGKRGGEKTKAESPITGGAGKKRSLLQWKPKKED